MQISTTKTPFNVLLPDFTVNHMAAALPLIKTVLHFENIFVLVSPISSGTTHILVELQIKLAYRYVLNGYEFVKVVKRKTLPRGTFTEIIILLVSFATSHAASPGPSALCQVSLIGPLEFLRIRHFQH